MPILDTKYLCEEIDFPASNCVLLYTRYFCDIEELRVAFNFYLPTCNPSLYTDIP